MFEHQGVKKDVQQESAAKLPPGFKIPCSFSDRVWSCGCGEVHRRDLNAALNLRAEGMRLVAVGQTETQNARGATRRPGKLGNVA